MAESIKIDTVHGMQFSMDDKDMYKDMVQLYCDQHDDTASKIKAELEGKDWENYRIHVHGLKSTSRTVGGMQLGDLAEKLEHAARDGDIATIEAETQNLLQMYDDTIAAMKQIDFAAL